MEDGILLVNLKWRVSIFFVEIMKYPNICYLGDSIAHIPEISMLTPRGKFDMYMLKNALKNKAPHKPIALKLPEDEREIKALLKVPLTFFIQLVWMKK
jgi:hypothetical protein